MIEKPNFTAQQGEEDVAEEDEEEETAAITARSWWSWSPVSQICHLPDKGASSSSSPPPFIDGAAVAGRCND